MKKFYEAYSLQEQKVSALLRQIGWTNNLTIMSRCKSDDERRFYLEALDRDVKKPKENPSIGVLLCKDKDDEGVEYALSRSLSPTMVAEYRLNMPDKKLLRDKLKEIIKDTGDDYK
jgi:hypothetical protein